MNTFHKSRLLVLVIALLLAACASTNMGASDRSEQAEKNVQSSTCRGKIDPNRTDGALRKISSFVDDPTSFFCNASYQMLFVIRDQARALGRAEQELAATRAIQGLENGTMGPKSVNVVANYKLSDEEKSNEIKMFQNSAYADRKAMMEAADRRMNFVFQDVAVGMGSVLLQIKKAQMAQEQAKQSKSDSDNFLAMLVTVKAGVDVIQTLSLAPGLQQAFGQWQENKAHLRAVLRDDQIDPRRMKVQPD